MTGSAATITGIGLVTPLARDVAGFFDQLCDGPIRTVPAT